MIPILTVTSWRSGPGGAVTARILVVDDDQDHCEALEATLQELGHEVCWTTDTTDALERVGRESSRAFSPT